MGKKIQKFIGDRSKEIYRWDSGSGLARRALAAITGGRVQ